MNFPFFNRLQVRKITVATTDEASRQASTMLEGLLRELPELLMSCIVDVQSGKIIASYTVHSSYNPNHVSLRYARALRSMQEALARKAWPGGPLTDVSVLLDEQLHLLYPFANGQRYCLLVVSTTDANLGLAKDVMRRCVE